MSQLRFDNQVAVVTGAGGGLGKIYALLLAERGAKVVINDLGGSSSGSGSNSRAADLVVEEIRKKGGVAVANYDSVEDGDKVIGTALQNFGRVDILINNAGILRDKSLAKMEDTDWDLIHRVHLKGAYKCTKAAWETFRKQKYGRIINTSSAAGMYGNFGQTNYSSAKHSLIPLTKTVALEGEKYNIKCNVICPIAASRLTEGIIPEDFMAAMKPDYVAPLVLYLAHNENQNSGDLFELAAGVYHQVRRERSKGVVFKADSSFTPSAVLKRWEEINDFKDSEIPQSLTDNDWQTAIEVASKAPSNPQAKEIRLNGKVAIVTGAGAGLGRCYAILLAKMGASVVVNDLGKSADAVVEEIKKFGGKAVANHDSVEFGQKIVDTAIKTFGGVHILVNNAGILRDKSIVKMTDQDFDLVYKVHLFGTYSVTKAAWNHFNKQKYGRIINTSSAVGLYGNFGQINYAAAKGGIIGFTNTIALEGERKNILSNVIAPNAGTGMTKGIIPDELHEMFKPEYIAPLVGLLASEECPSNGDIFESGSCKISRVRWQRSQGVAFPPSNITPEQIKQNWEAITGFDKDVSNPSSTSESFQHFYEQYSLQAEKSKSKGEFDSATGESITSTEEFEYSNKDTILYNLSIGATAKELEYTYESHDNFRPLPTFPVISSATAVFGLDYGKSVPNYDPVMLLHGEQYVEIVKPLPSEGKLKVTAKVVEVLDKGKGAVLVVNGSGVDVETGETMYNIVFTGFIRGSGGFGGKSKGSDRGPSTAANIAPSRKPDVVASYKTNEDLAALYRLNGDWNPLHIDPDFAAVGGFNTPILHGLCSYGISVKLIIDKLGNRDPASVHRMKTRFTKHVFPGETLEVRMWKDDTNPKKIIFQTYVPERDVIVLDNSAVEFFEDVQLPPKSHL